MFPAFAVAAYVPHQGDTFSYHEVESLGSGTGNYAGYTEQTIVNGQETMNGVSAGGVVSASYSYSWTWSNSSGTTENADKSGDYTFSSATLLYLNGTDDQTGYVNPTVWFLMDNSTPIGNTFMLLNTEMTVVSTSFSYYLSSENRNVDTIYASGTSSYQRNDVYGQFTAAYTWKAYFDPATGYIIGYNYVEHDTNASGDGFTYTDNLYVTSTSYLLTTTAGSSSSGGNSGITQEAVLIAGIIVIVAVIAVVIYALSRRHRKSLPQHAYQPQPQPGPPPPDIDLTPKQPPVQQIVIKEVVKVKCRYCGALIDSTAQTCPICGAPRT